MKPSSQIPTSTNTCEPCSEPHSELPFKVKSIDQVVRWKYPTINQECYICRKPLDQTCPECNDICTCKSVKLVCCHAFHYHCIERWSYNSAKCPIDQEPIRYIKKETII